mmetsp:Transcript_20567/g.60734  ORF Transcript_20567/g.60734 Transcript_20567/m.60734 type:complete len:227 (+) Transcript_20567:562-1242(+)
MPAARWLGVRHVGARDQLGHHTSLGRAWGAHTAVADASRGREVGRTACRARATVGEGAGLRASNARLGLSREERELTPQGPCEHRGRQAAERRPRGSGVCAVGCSPAEGHLFTDVRCWIGQCAKGRTVLSTPRRKAPRSATRGHAHGAKRESAASAHSVLRLSGARRSTRSNPEALRAEGSQGGRGSVRAVHVCGDAAASAPRQAETRKEDAPGFVGRCRPSLAAA